jgi:hypothetical protein
VLLQEYPNLERVILKHADYLEVFNHRSRWKELPQEALIKFVRHTSKLRWFCSDLTQENIAILKEERPEVEFCNYCSIYESPTHTGNEALLVYVYGRGNEVI